jgi:phage terminase large subunit GpA-like protein
MRASDQRKPFVPCPHCGEFQILEFKRLEWEKGKPEDAAIPLRKRKLRRTHPTSPKGLDATCRANGVRSNPISKFPAFWLSQMYSTRRTWARSRY